MKTVMTVLLATLAALAAPSARADLSVFACEPEWGSLVQELGGPHVSVYNATTGRQDPHQIQARPGLIAKVRAADLTVCTGAELEVGWMPMIQRQAANSKILAGQPGSFEATRYVSLMDIPTRLSRADGDIHAAGNPHIQTDPRAILIVAKPLSERLAQLDSGNAADYGARYTAFVAKWREAIDRWSRQAAPLEGVPVAVQHRNWAYLFDWLGLNETVALEPKPGIPPSSGYLIQVVDQVRRQPVRMVIRAAYEDSRPSDFLHDQAGVPAVTLPFTVGGTPGANDLYGLFDETVNRLLEGLGAGKS